MKTELIPRLVVKINLVNTNARLFELCSPAISLAKFLFISCDFVGYLVIFIFSTYFKRNFEKMIIANEVGVNATNS